MRVKRRYVLVALAVTAASAAAQRYRMRGDASVEPNPSYDGRYAFVRLRYGGEDFRCWSNEGPGWHHDYPVADRNLMKIMSELTTLDARLDSSMVLDEDDPALMKYPIAYLSEPGCWQQTDAQVKALRAYLLKGGFLIVDDFSIRRHWYNFVEQMQRVLPEGRLVQLDVSNPAFQSFFGVQSLEMSGYRGRAEFYGIYEDNDSTKRLMVVANANNDIGDYWQWSAEGFLPIPLTNEAYKIGVNYLMYGFTH
ncbi:MAG TPA: DUF4159 domain-containing protein [Gemmatimonadaceae bacterium]|nr:DUF4159 domain-containing protein [Gemmatimonadaceae bacterium]